MTARSLTQNPPALLPLLNECAFSDFCSRLCSIRLCFVNYSGWIHSLCFSWTVRPSYGQCHYSTLLDFGEYSCVFLLSPNPGVELLGGFWLNEVFFQSLFTSLHSDQHMNMLIAPSKIWPDIISIFKALFSYCMFVKIIFVWKAEVKRYHLGHIHLVWACLQSVLSQLPSGFLLTSSLGAADDGPSTWVTRMELLVLGFELT